jgi:hypothetical protein
MRLKNPERAIQLLNNALQQEGTFTSVLIQLLMLSEISAAEFIEKTGEDKVKLYSYFTSGGLTALFSDKNFTRLGNGIDYRDGQRWSSE